MLSESEIVLLTGSSNPSLACEIGATLDQKVHSPIKRFADSEVRVFPTSVSLRGKDVFIIQSTSRFAQGSVNDSILELLLMADAARRADASKITAVMPYFGYARQDRKEQPRVPISSALVVRMLEEAGIDRLLTMDIHSEQQEGALRRRPWDNLFGSHVLLPEIAGRHQEHLKIASPDMGGAKRARAYNSRLSGEGVAIVDKERDVKESNRSRALTIYGRVKDKNVWLIDDILDTGNSVLNAAGFLYMKGACSVRMAVTHGLFSADAIERISASKIKEVLITNTVSLKPEIINNPKITVVSVGPLFAEAIRRIHQHEPLSDLID